MLFNLYVADLQDNLPPTVTSFQYADDTTMYTSCTASSITSQADALNSSLASLSSWSRDSNLALNAKKTKAMLISTPQIARAHSLQECDLRLTISGKPLECVRLSELLGVYLSDHLKWDDHISQLSKSCYGVLHTLCKLKNFSAFKFRKHLAETLILSKLYYCDTVFYPLPQFLVKRLQWVQFAAACFVTGKYVNDISVILKLGWLPVKERRDWHLLKRTFKATYSPLWPSYLPIDIVKNTQNLCSNVAAQGGGEGGGKGAPATKTHIFGYSRL